ncbi:uncharacterized protein LOC130817769 isoform X2 [Amaranthus tricolor]|uniref:uncharacterized protein LOC130817769 isoform X2 n=1 Tax=Amaranthus tricolor TaxID=29722 RepID=UPI00258B0A82|nr:uncharacterized protein LOC130817769 isoform X2 [Amaranthus tricolor]
MVMSIHSISYTISSFQSFGYSSRFSHPRNRWDSHPPQFKTSNFKFTQKLSISSSIVRSISPSSMGADSSSVAVGESDLLIVGPGVLGRLVAQQWIEDHPGCQVYGKTATTDHHDELTKLGITPVVKGAMLPYQFPYVIFCAPPSKSPDYAGEVRLKMNSTCWKSWKTLPMVCGGVRSGGSLCGSREATSSWNGEGSFVFTSSSALVDCSDNGSCDEDTPAVPMGRSPRTDVLLKAENVVLDHGGCVLRLAGLYISFLSSDLFLVSLGMHWDAASLTNAILKKKFRARVFLGCDNHPLSRQEIMDLVNKSGKFSDKFEAFTGTDGSLGKRMNNSKSRVEIGWEPKYPSFAEFLQVIGEFKSGNEG